MNKATIKKATTLVFAMLFSVGFSASLFAQNTLYGNELVTGGDFAADSISDAWSTFLLDGVSASFDASTGEVAITGLTGASGTGWHIQFNQILTAEQLASLDEGSTYELSFDARTATDSTKQLDVFFGENGGGFTNYASGVELTGATTTFTQEMEVMTVFSDMKLGFESGSDNNPVYLDNISIRKKTDNILVNGGFDMTPPDSMWTTEGGNGTVTYVDGELAITEITAGNPWEIQVFQDFNQESLDSIYVGPYEINFDARTGEGLEKTFNLYFGENIPGGSWTNFAGGVTITGEMTSYNVPVDVAQTWSAMKLGFEVGADANPIYFDNVTLTRVREIKPAAPAFALSTADGIVTVTVTGQADAASYDIYFSNAAIESPDSSGVTLVGTVDAETGLTFDHSTSAPHPDLVEEFTAHYAVIAKTEAGTESDLTTESILTEMSVAKNYAAELTTDAVDAVFNAIDADEIPAGSALATFFPDNYVPFEISSDNKVVVSGEGGDDDSDISSLHWIGFDAVDNLLIIYAEVTDDSVVLASEAVGSGGAWDYDSWEAGIGNYSPESFIVGSTHTGYMFGAEPDWQLRGGGLALDAGTRGFIHGYGIEATRLNGEIPNSATLFEKTDTGWRALTLITTVSLSGGPTEDVAWQFPTGSEIKLYPLQISLNDNDGASRDTQVNWGDATINGDWWQRPQQWNTVAFVGSEKFPTSNEGEVVDNVVEYSLQQNYPNPFNPSTSIEFTLANNTLVTLEVYNMLGQKVATLLSNERMSAGSHMQRFDASSLASGMYLYRLVTPTFTQSRKMMLIK